MARFAQILSPAGDAVIKIAALTTSTSSANQFVGSRRIIVVNADQDITIAFGAASSMAAADATNYRIPSNQQTTFDMGSNSYLRVFNLSASTAANVWVMRLEGR